MKLKFSLLDGSLKPEFPAIGEIFMPALSSLVATPKSGQSVIGDVSSTDTIAQRVAAADNSGLPTIRELWAS
jgi:hypothetical protein